MLGLALPLYGRHKSLIFAGRVGATGQASIGAEVFGAAWLLINASRCMLPPSRLLRTFSDMLFSDQSVRRTFRRLPPTEWGLEWMGPALSAQSEGPLYRDFCNVH